MIFWSNHQLLFDDLDLNSAVDCQLDEIDNATIQFQQSYRRGDYLRAGNALYRVIRAQDRKAELEEFIP